MKYLLATLTGMLLLNGCVSFPTDHHEAKTSAQDRLAAAYASVTPEQSSSGSESVIRKAGFFVPAVEPGAENSTSWSNEWIEFAVVDYPISMLLREILLPQHVNVRFLDGIDGQGAISLRFSGELREALRQISALTGFAVEAEQHIVTVRRFELAEFDVAFLSGITSFFLGEDGRESRAGQSSAGMNKVVNEESAQYLNFTSDALSVWNDLEAAIALLLSEDGAVVINQSSTSVLVRDYPQYVTQIRAYLEQQNLRLTRQVAVDVQVIDVAFNDQRQVGIDWELVAQTTSGGSIVNFAAGGRGGPITSPLGQLGVSRSGGRFNGSQALIQALSLQGVVEVSNHPRVVSLNNQIAKVVLEDNSTYLASAGSSSTVNVGSKDLLIPGVVTTGFELYVLPKVSNSQIVMQVSTGLSDLVSIDQVTSGDKTIQTPHTNRKKFFMKAMVGDGETLLISGLQNSRRHWQEQRGLFSWIFGGQREQRTQHTETVLLLTPKILPPANSL